MGVPNGHPFFGNQYTDGGYEIGSYTYTAIADTLKEVSKSPELKRVVSNIDPVKIKSNKLPNGLSNKQIGIGVSLALVGIGLIAGVTTYSVKRIKAKKKKESILANVGLCKKCEQPLLNGKYVPGSETESPYIICLNCKAKNYAQYEF